MKAHIILGIAVVYLLAIGFDVFPVQNSASIGVDAVAQRKGVNNNGYELQYEDEEDMGEEEEQIITPKKNEEKQKEVDDEDEGFYDEDEFEVFEVSDSEDKNVVQKADRK